MSESDVVEVVARACALRCPMCNSEARWQRHEGMALGVLDALTRYTSGDELAPVGVQRQGPTRGES